MQWSVPQSATNIFRLGGELGIAKFVLAVFSVLVLTGVGLVYLAPETVVRWAINADRSRADLTRKEIVLPDGRRYVYLEGGKGEPLLLIHGFGANKDAFSKVAAYLTPHYHVIAPDLLGFGESDRPEDADYAPMAQAERLHALTQALGLDNLNLGGSSMGGHIALSYAGRYPAEVKSLWLIDSGGVWSAPNVTAPNDIPVSVRSGDDLSKVMSFYMSKPPYIPAPMLNVLAKERIENFSLEQRILKQVTSNSVESILSDVAAPTLIVWGEQDRALGVATASILHKLLENSQVIIMPGTGHLPMIERPQQTAEDYIHFRATLSSPSKQ